MTFGPGCATSTIVLTLGWVLAAGAAGATSQRTFVATYGSDGSPTCSVVAPCRSLGTAIVRTGPAGEVIVLDSGGYGPLTITQSVSLIAPAGVYAGISVLTGLDGIVVDGPGIAVVLRGLSINGQGGNVGVKWLQGTRLYVEGCIIANLSQDGIYSSSKGELIVTDSIIRGNGGAGVVSASGMTLIDRSRLENNQNGALLADGDFVESGALTVTNSVVVGNVQFGIAIDSATGQDYRMVVDGSVVSDHTLAGILVYANTFSKSRAVVTRSTFARNGDGIRGEGFEGNVTISANGNAVASSANNGILATGATAYIVAGANTLQQNAGAGMRGAASSTIATRGDNGIVGPSPLSGTVVSAPSY